MRTLSLEDLRRTVRLEPQSFDRGLHTMARLIRDVSVIVNHTRHSLIGDIGLAGDIA
jgi:hypothetical protein